MEGNEANSAKWNARRFGSGRICENTGSHQGTTNRGRGKPFRKWGIMEGNEANSAKWNARRFGSGRICENTGSHQGTTNRGRGKPFRKCGRNESRFLQTEQFGRNQNQPAIVNEQSMKLNGFGYRRLDSLSSLQGREIMEILATQQTLNEFLSLSSQADLEETFIVRIVYILGKLARTEFDQIVVQLLSQICTSTLLNQVLCYILKYQGDELTASPIESAFEFFHHLSIFCHRVLKLLPTLACERLSSIIKQSILLLNSLNFEGIQTVKEVMKINLERLNAEKEKRKQQPVKRTVDDEASLYTSPPDDFRDLSTAPRADDLLCLQRIFLRKSIIEGPYMSVDHYLDVQYRLIREDFMRPLRDGIQEYIRKKKEGKEKIVRVNNIKIYPEVLFQGTLIVEDKVGVKVCFDQHKKFCGSFSWDQSKRFMLGSLLVLSRDNFETILLAEVLKRNINELLEGTIVIEVLGDVNNANALSQNWVMVESSLFYGAYSHVLKALKDFDELNFPLKDYIIKGQSERRMPDYLIRAQLPEYDIPTKLVNGDKDDKDKEEKIDVARVKLDDNLTWPCAGSLGLDESQFEAFKGALTNKVMLIQGPPGTGKTYLGLRIASALLNNSQVWDVDDDECGRPLVVICYTNHALDQFLMGIKSFTDSIARVGGGCKEEGLKEFSIRNQRQHCFIEGHLYEMTKECREAFGLWKYEYEVLKEAMAIIQSGGGILDPVCLYEYGVMSEDQIYSFESKYDFMAWLEHGIQMKVLNKSLDFNETSAIILEEEENGIDKSLYFIVSFSKLSIDNEYYMQKKMYFEHQLNNPVTKPELLDKEVVKRLRTLRNMPVESRWQLYRHWVNELLKILDKKQRDVEPNLQRAASNLKHARMVEEEHVMSNCKVIGMTTSYAASRRSILKQLRPRIVIVEEAAEVLEAHVVSSLTASVEHLIMIGDHLQLKPNPAVYELATKYHLDVSLFERLINNKVSCVSLTTQHRMRMEIAKLVCPTIYPLLKNHESVLRYPPVMGVTKSVAFIRHTHPQEEVSEIQSFRNRHEAKFISSMVRYLRLQGYNADQITVLATYKGQMFYLNQIRKENPLMTDVRITVVDNFQGEENDVILLSLVRSNDEANIGFLKTENRVCVALSRAKHGLFIIGNMENMLSKGDIWPKICEVLKEQDALVDHLDLICQVHSTITPVSSAADFGSVPEGGCLRQCGTLLSCGHICSQMCHATDREHQTFRCFEACERPACVKNHTCPCKCFEPCKPCMVPTNVVLPCQHEAVLPCHVEPSNYECLETVTCKLVACEHSRDVCCFQTKILEKVKCIEPCIARLDCGHACQETCHALSDPDHVEYKCMKPCGERNIGCTRDHKCLKVCHEECGKCVIMVKKILSCGHDWSMKCCDEPSREFCGMECTAVNDCGHKCTKMCKEECKPCSTQVLKTIPRCGHQQMMSCSIDPATFEKCAGDCNLILACGHKCTKKCHEECTKQCKILVPYPKVTGCGHTIRVACSKQNILDPNSDELLEMCNEPCKVLLKPCNHQCKGSCGSCWQGRLHRTCTEPCGRVLVCGHSCQAPCAEMCPPCNAPCLVRCQHSNCPRKCGAPCSPCKERCLRFCKHVKCTRECGEVCNVEACQKPCDKTLKDCKHKCIGLCGDLCICQECHEDVREIFFGTEEEENARFVILPDCKHVFEVSGLEQWLTEGGAEIKEKVCPKCKAPIRKCVRYSEIILKHSLNVQKVKSKMFGNVHSIQNVARNASQILDKLSDNSSLSGELLRLVIIILRHLRTVSDGIKKKKTKAWNFQPSISLTEVNNLLQYSKLLLNLSDIMMKALSRGQHVSSDMSEKGKLGVRNYIPRHFRSGNSSDMSEKGKLEVRNYIHKFARHLIRSGNLLRISVQEENDFFSLLKRLDALVQVCFIESSPAFSCLLETPTLQIHFECVASGIRRVSQYSEAKYLADCKVLKEAASVVRVEISAAEIRSIVGAMGSAKGHWFECPLGHVYYIGNCGGAVEESVCNECGNKIGGIGHRLRADNRSVTMMDGAQ